VSHESGDGVEGEEEARPGRVDSNQQLTGPVEPHPYDPKQAKQLMIEAGYPNGFDAGVITPIPPYYSFAEAVAGYLGAIGIKAKVLKMERAVMFDKRRKKELGGICLCANGGSGNAVTRATGG
jgi:peptide/nickel transport system substrate-binding protein